MWRKQLEAALNKAHCLILLLINQLLHDQLMVKLLSVPQQNTRDRKVRGITDTSVFSCMWQIKVHPGIWRATSASSHLNMFRGTLRSVCLQISQQILIWQQNLIQLYCFAGSGLVCWFCSSPVHMSSVQNQSRTPDPTLSWWWWMIWALETSVAMETTPSG